MNIVIINCFDVYEHRVEMLKKAFASDGHRVSVIIPNFRHIQKCMRTHCPEGFEMLPVKPYYMKFSLARIRSHIQFAKDALAAAEKKEPDLLWVLAPPNSLVKDAALYKRKHAQVRLILDFIDLWPESMPVKGFAATPPGRIWSGLRDDYMDAADTVVVESSRYRKTLNKRCREKKLYTLYISRNTKLRRLANRRPHDRIALCFLGRLNDDIDFQALEALLKEIDAPVELHVIGEGDQKAVLGQTAERAGAKVIFYGEIYAPEKKRDIFDRCHFGLNLLKNDVRPGLTMKGVEYLEASLPILNNVRGDTWNFIEKYPVGLNYDANTRITAAKLLAMQGRRGQIQPIFDTYFAEKVFFLNVQKIIRS